MRLTFRAKLMALVGTTALAFVVLIVASALISKRVQEELTRIEGLYVPRLEWGPRLEAQFARITRGMQEAVAAGDAEALAETQKLKDGFLQQLTAAGETVDPAQAAALRSALEDYYATAFEVSRRLIGGETGEAVVESMAAMQAKQKKAAEILREATRFDREALTAAFAAAAGDEARATEFRLLISVACLALVLLLSVWVGRGVLNSLAALASGFQRFGRGEFSLPIPVTSQDELGDVSQQANQMAQSLKRLGDERDRTDWLKNGHAGLAQELRGELEPKDAAGRATSFVARYLEAPVGALYCFDRAGVLQLLGQHALAPGVRGPGAALGVKNGATPSFRPGEGLVGQAALQDEIMIVADPPADYLRIRSGLGEGAPRVIALLPLVHAGKVMGVLELALLKPWSEPSREFLLSVRETVAIALEVARARAETRTLLAETQQQAARLTTQEEELRSTNEELQAQQEELRQQQEELRQTNEELAQQTEELEVQRRTLQEKNVLLDDARRVLEQKADELTTVSAYKSQFLTNMSHELRTPLNSMLLLSSLLAENEGKNLTEKQVEFCKTIHSAGKDLLALINQVLDLAKVESGRQEVRIQQVPLRHFVERAQRVFDPLARDKGLAFSAEIAPGLPDVLLTDSQRVEQILTNLLGNAIKFTERGEVALRIRKPEADVRFRNPRLRADRSLALEVSDTGPGIAPEHQERVFAPFEQVDAKPDRRYGGTGLGLSIARELAALLGGELMLRSTPGRGSTFTCYLPFDPPVTAASGATPPGPMAARSGSSAPAGTATPEPGAALGDGAAATAGALREEAGFGDDRDGLQPGDPHLLIIEDDLVFATTFGEVIHGQGLRYLLAADGESGLRLAREHKPSGIILDVKLPDVNGFAVMERLRADPATAGIPVHFVSAVDAPDRGMALGAVGYLTKPVTRRDLVRVIESLVPSLTDRANRILVVEDDALTADSLVKLLTAENLLVRRAANARDALEEIRKERFGCMILDLSLPDMDGLDLLRRVADECGPEMPSVVIYTARALSKAEARQLEAYTDAIVLKEGPSRERLLNEVRLFVRRLKEGLAPRRQIAASPHPADLRLEGRKILIVDDDMRTLYALSATLRAKGVQVFVADTGRAALAALAEHPDVEAVLMDIMMPEMDGYEAMRRIRQEERWRSLPIIALTAKAMKGDEEKCREAGASDYLPKPIDADRLLAMLHSRLTRSGPPDAA